MKLKNLTRELAALAIALAVVMPAPVLLAGATAGSTSVEPGSEIWDDPTFRSQFLGSYGFQSEIEPAVDLDEQTLLQEILPLFPDELDQAERLLLELLAPEQLADASDAEKAPKKKPSRRHGTDDDARESPPSAVFDFLLGNVYYQMHLNGEGEGDALLEKALPHYRDAVSKFPAYRRAHKNLGLILVQLGRFDEAIEPLSRVIQLGGGDGLTYGLMGWALASTDRFVSAESAFRSALLLQPTTLDWTLGLTQAALRQQKYEEAISLCDELIAHDPDRADYWLLQANAYIGAGQPMKAAENFELLDRMGQSTAASLYTLGDIYVNGELYDLAARAYGKAMAEDPAQPVERPLRSVEVFAQRGALAQASGLLDTVKQAYDDRLGPDQRTRLLKLEARLAVADGEGGDAAVDVLEEIVALDPLDGEALLLLGQHYARESEPERAIFYYERAQSIEAYEADARVRHAQVLVDQARYGEAIPLLKRAQEIKPRDDVARYLEQVERVARARR